MIGSMYYIVSVKNTPRRDSYITFWRSDDRGYAYPLSWAGKYQEEHVRAAPGYYNNGSDTFAVRCDVADALAVPPAPRMIDNDAGPVVLNTRENWKALFAGVIAPTSAPPVVTPRDSRRRLTLRT